MFKEMQDKLAAGSGAIPRIKRVLWQETTISVYSIGWMSYLTFLAAVTIRKWEREGIIPKPFFKLAGSNRWYSAAELLLYSSTIHRMYQYKRDLRSLKLELHKLSVQIRRRYLKVDSTLPQEYIALKDEVMVAKKFRQHKFKEKLTRQGFFEVNKIVGHVKHKKVNDENE